MKIVSLAEHPEHSRQVAEWYYDEWVDPTSDKSLDDVFKEICGRLSLKGDIPEYYIAIDTEQLLGVVELKYRENQSYPEYVHWLGGLYVNAEARMRGIASKLIKFDKKRAHELGVKELYLQCEQHLVDLYLKHEFNVCHGATHGDMETTIMVCDIGTSRTQSYAAIEAE